MPTVNPRNLRTSRGGLGRTAAAVYRPGSTKGVIAKRMALGLRGLGAYRLDEADVAGWWPSLESPVGRPSGFACIDSSRAGRSIYGRSEGLRLVTVAKVSHDPDVGIEQEIAAAGLAPFETFRRPEVLGYSRAHPWAIAFRAVEGNPIGCVERTFPVLRELRERELVHGDFAPWNVLEADGDAIFVLDWEAHTTGSDPYFDFFTFVYRHHRLLMKAPAADLIGKLTGPSSVVSRYERFMDLGDGGWVAAFRSFLESSPYEDAPSVAEYRSQLLGLLA